MRRHKYLQVINSYINISYHMYGNVTPSCVNSVDMQIISSYVDMCGYKYRQVTC
jgi:hypothetical protein